MNLDERKKYTLTMFSTFIRFFIVIGAIVLLSFIVTLFLALVSQSVALSPMEMLSGVLRAIIVGGVVGGWLFAGILAGILLVSNHFERKKKGSAWLFFLFVILAIPVGILVGVPLAIYMAVKYKIPIKMEFESRQRSRKRKKRTK